MSLIAAYLMRFEIAFSFGQARENGKLTRKTHRMSAAAAAAAVAVGAIIARMSSVHSRGTKWTPTTPPPIFPVMPATIYGAKNVPVGPGGLKVSCAISLIFAL